MKQIQEHFELILIPLWFCRLLYTRCNQFVQNFLFALEYVLLGLLMHLEHFLLRRSSLSEQTKKKHKFFAVFLFLEIVVVHRLLSSVWDFGDVCKRKHYVPHSNSQYSGRREHNFDNPTLISGCCC